MAVGWAAEDDTQRQIDDSIADAVEQARSHLTKGVSSERCEDCDEPIPEARRLALRGVTRCVECQSEADGLQRYESVYNRKGCKDSQLK
jgi:phage/conjugal plasmid C-4 type zinc finger TraR family protein